MGKPATITVGDDTVGTVRVEYVRHRRTLRLWGWRGATPPRTPVELPLQALVELGVASDDLVPPHRFLLFGGGRGPAKGGAGDLLATFESEARARDAFIALRRRGDAEWAELVALAAKGGLKRLAWFGSPVRGGTIQGAQAKRDRGGRRRRDAGASILAVGLTATVVAGLVVANAVTGRSSRSMPRPSPRAIQVTAGGSAPDPAADLAAFAEPGGD